MSSHDYLHEKAEESRHNETLAYMMFLAGIMFFVGGILETISLGAPAWFFIIPYSQQANPGMFLGSTMIISGIGLVIFGIFAAAHYSRDRGWYMQELRKAGTSEDGILRKKLPKTVQTNKSAKA
jgi:uncharacterized membrane protein YiaA